MNTCATCIYCEIPYGESNGFCWGVPPATHKDGTHHSVHTPAPIVRIKRPACWHYQGTPDGATHIKQKSKDNMDTPGDAAKLAHIDKAADDAVQPPKGLPIHRPQKSEPPAPRRRNTFKGF